MWQLVELQQPERCAGASVSLLLERVLGNYARTRVSAPENPCDLKPNVLVLHGVGQKLFQELCMRVKNP